MATFDEKLINLELKFKDLEHTFHDPHFYLYNYFFRNKIAHRFSSWNKNFWNWKWTNKWKNQKQSNWIDWNYRVGFKKQPASKDFNEYFKGMLKNVDSKLVKITKDESEKIIMTKSFEDQLTDIEIEIEYLDLS